MIEKITTIEMFEKDPYEYIWMADEKLVCESRFGREFDGDLKLLLSCIEDNIYTNDDGDGEGIDYIEAVREYRKQQRNEI